MCLYGQEGRRPSMTDVGGRGELFTLVFGSLGSEAEVPCVLVNLQKVF